MLDYLRLSKGLIGQTSELIPASENIYKKLTGQLNQDWYTSLFRYSKEHAEAFKTSKSVAGIRGLKTNRLLFDFDAINLEDARIDAVETCNRLVKLGVNKDQILPFFSGGKGFHVTLVLNEFISRQEFVNIVFGVASDLKTFDTTINDEARIIRLPLSQHPKTKLYKIPLTVADLQNASIDEIKGWAKSNDYDSDMIKDENFKIDLPASLAKLKTVEAKKVTAELITKTDIKGFNVEDMDFTNAPKWMSKDRYALSQGFFYGSESVDKGERNIAFLILAATYKNQGFSAEHTLALLEVTAEKQAQRTDEKPYTTDQLQREIINAVFSPSWKGGQFSSDEPLLQLTRERFNLQEPDSIKSNLVKIEDVGQRFRNFAKNFEENRIFTGFKSLDDKLVLTTSMTIGILGSPGSGKTSVLNSIVEHQSLKGIPCIYQSLDMSDNLLYMRLLQKYTSLPIDKLLNYFKEENPDPAILQAYAEILKNYSNVHFNFRSAMTVEQIDKDIEAYKEQTGKSPKVIAVDYLEKVRSNFTDPSVSSGMVASQLSDLAKKHDALVILLLQPQKSAGDPSQELLSMRKVKGSSVIEQDLRVILTCWRPGFSPQEPHNDKYMSVGIVKNNLGETAQLDFGWHGLTGAITELDSQSRSSLRQLREEIKAKEEKQKDWDV